MSAKPQSIRNRSEESEEGARHPYEASAVCKSVADRVNPPRIPLVRIEVNWREFVLFRVGCRR
jgi:hypothetical protein